MKRIFNNFVFILYEKETGVIIVFLQEAQLELNSLWFRFYSLFSKEPDFFPHYR